MPAAKLAGLAVAIAMATWGCADRLAGAPRLDRVEPDAAPPGTAVRVAVRGEFFPDVRLSSGGGSSHVDARFAAVLGVADLIDVRYVDASRLDATIPATLAPGVYALAVVDPAGRTGRLERAFTVGAGPQLRLSIEDAPGGAGAAVGDVTVPAGAQLALHAVARDAAGGFVADADAAWTSAGAAGTLAPTAGNQTVFTATTPGQTAVVRADVAGVGVDDTGTITVVACTGPADCADPCFSQATCAAGVCDLGPVDRDADGDTFVDAACPGGTDCDDSPAGCGAACHPGAVELCDGRDNDCLATTVDGAQAPGFGLACDGADTDLCLDGTTICTGTALACDDPIASTVEGPPGDPSCTNSIDDDCDLATDSSDPGCVAVTPGTPPLVSMRVTPPVGATSTVFQGDASATTDREGGPLTFAWDWDGDGGFDATGPTPTHTYAAAGDYLVSVRVTDPSGLAAWASFTVVVGGAGPIGTVTIAADENDGTAGPGPDFSLREAILWANATAGRQIIVVPPGMTVVLTGALPGIADVAGTTIVGDGAAVDGAALGGSTNCLTITGAGTVILGLEIRGCPNFAITITDGSGSRVERAYVHNNQFGIRVAFPDNTVGPDNRIFDNVYQGVVLNGRGLVRDNRFTGSSDGMVWSTQLGNGSVVVGNVFTDGVVGIGVNSFFSGMTVHHNTFAYLTTSSIGVVGAGDGFDFRNNLVAFNTGLGLNASDAALTFKDHNLFFANAGGDCACTLPAGTVTTDPRFIDGAARDLRVFAGSPAVDAGALLGRDRNRAGPGLHDGAGPDLGAWESPY